MIQAHWPTFQGTFEANKRPLLVGDGGGGGGGAHQQARDTKRSAVLGGGSKVVCAGLSEHGLPQLVCIVSTASKVFSNNIPVREGISLRNWLANV